MTRSLAGVFLLAALTATACTRSAPPVEAAMQPELDAGPQPKATATATAAGLAVPPPSLATLQTDIGKALFELNAMAVASRKKKRTASQCETARDRAILRTAALGKLSEHALGSWPEQHEDLAHAFDKVLLEMRRCVDCAPPDFDADCGPAEEAMVSLRRLIPVVDLDDAPAMSSTVTLSNLSRLRQCCASLRMSARAAGGAPSAGVFLQAAARCDVMAQVPATNTVPTLGVLRQLLSGATIPAVCAGF
jgi:hypothetical protein